MSFQEINFNGEKFKYIICIDGELPDLDFFKNFESSIIISADGATNYLYKMGIIPDILIGDLDSVDNNIISKLSNSKIIKIEDQESNDFEKALNYTIENEYENILVVGFHGGELEHTLNNWSVFKKYSKKLNLTIFDLGRYGFVIDKNTRLETQENEIISLIPQPYVKLTTNGLKWNLDNEILNLGFREGARNQAISNSIELEIIEGELLYFCNARINNSLKIK